MNKFFEAIANVFAIPDLRKRVLFTLGLLAVYRLGGHIPTPGIDANQLEGVLPRRIRARIFGFFDLFSGGNIRRLTIFALGIMPYITSSIILQLLTVVVPTLEKLQKEGELGRRKITQWTRYLTVILALDPVLRHRQPACRAMRRQFRHQSRLRLHPDDHADADHRHGLHHVAGRADHRARHRQRHVADHLHRHRGRICRTPSAKSISNVFMTGEWNAAAAGHHPGHDGRGGGVHRAGRARRAPHPGAVRQARGRAAR